MSEMYNAIGTRFVRQVSSVIPTPASATVAESAAVFERLRLSGTWSEITNPNINAALPITGSNETDNNLTSMDFFDAYSFCANHVTGQHKLYMGSACYRITFPNSLIGKTLTQISTQLFGDAFLADGMRFVIHTSTNTVPERDWSDVSLSSAMVEGAVRRSEEPAPEECATCKRWKARGAQYNLYTTETKTDGSVVVFPSQGITIQRFMYMYVSLENYQRVRNAWVEGSAMANRKFVLTVSGNDLPPSGDLPQDGGETGVEIIIPTTQTAVSATVQQADCLDVTDTFPENYTYVGSLIYNRSVRAISNLLTSSSLLQIQAGELLRAIGRSRSAVDESHVCGGNSAIGVSGSSGINTAVGLIANLYTRVDTTSSTMHYASSFVIIPLPTLFSCKKLQLKHIVSSALTITNATVQVGIWFLPYSGLNVLSPLAEITNKYVLTPDFWRMSVETFGALQRKAVKVLPSVLQQNESVTFAFETPVEEGYLIIVPYLTSVSNMPNASPTTITDNRGLVAAGTGITAVPYDTGTSPNMVPTRWATWTPVVGWQPNVILS